MSMIDDKKANADTMNIIMAGIHSSGEKEYVSSKIKFEKSTKV